MRSATTRLACGVAALPLLVALAGCAPASDRRGGRVPVTVATVEARTVPYELDATGTVEPLASADVIPQVGGMVTRVAFREGDDVRAGEVLVEIEPRVFEAEVARVAAILERDRAQARSTQLELERAERLAEQQLLSTGELDTKRAAAQAMAATVLADSASLVRARLDVARATVRAPISGRTGRLAVHVGDVVRANDPANTLVTIHTLRPIRVRFTIPQADLAEVRAERRRDVRVRVFSGPADTAGREGSLAFVDNQVDAASGTLLLKGEFANADGALWPGAFVRVRVQLREQLGAIVVPASAVSNSQSGPYCYVVKADTTVELRPVVVARIWRELTVVAAGLSPGEVVVTDGQVRLAPGARAAIRAGAGAAPGGGEAAPTARGGGAAGEAARPAVATGAPGSRPAEPHRP
jgi:multidrug efflux system membrane fusion protein